MPIKNMLALHAAVVQGLGFTVVTSKEYERLYDQGQKVSDEALIVTAPSADDLRLFSITKGGFQIELAFWAPNLEYDTAMLRVNLRAQYHVDDFEEVETQILHEYINLIEAVGIFRLAVEKYTAAEKRKAAMKASPR